jgi:hypothetical protein
LSSSFLHVWQFQSFIFDNHETYMIIRKQSSRVLLQSILFPVVPVSIYIYTLVSKRNPDVKIVDWIKHTHSFPLSPVDIEICIDAHVAFCLSLSFISIWHWTALLLHSSFFLPFSLNAYINRVKLFPVNFLNLKCKLVYNRDSVFVLRKH